MRITWATRSFLDYRIIVFKTLAEMPDVEFTLITSEEFTPERVRRKCQEALGNRIVFLTGEKCFGTPYSPEQRGNSVKRVFWQPGLSRKILETNPDVVITDAFNHWTLPVYNLRRTHNFKHILCYERTAHTERNAPWLKRKFIRFVGRWVDAVHYNGSLCHDFLRQLGYPEYKLKFGNMTVDVRQLSGKCNAVGLEERKALREKLGISSEESVFLFIGRLIPLKGLLEFLHAWKSWRDSQAGLSVKLLLVGEGFQEDELRRFCSEQGLDNVIFAGACTYDEIPKYYALSDIFVIPTLDDNWSLVVPEAMSCGKPILCSCYNGCWPEMVQEGKNGWVFDTLNEKDTVECLSTAYGKRAEWNRMGEYSRRLVDLYSPEQIVSSIYRTCKEKNTSPQMPLIPSIIEKCRKLFESCLMYKVYWGIVARYRKTMKMNDVPNRRVEGEQKYLAKWKPLSRKIATEEYRLFSRYAGKDENIVPEAVSHNVVEAILNPVQYRSFYSDKNMFDKLLEGVIMPKTYLRRVHGVFRDAEYSFVHEMDLDLEGRLGVAGRCVIKPAVDSSSGQKVTIFEKRDDGFWGMNGELKGERMTLSMLKRYFGDDFIIQEYLEQSDYMRQFCSTSVNTIRLCVYRSVKDEKICIPAIIMRLGCEGSFVDNTHAGGYAVSVDQAGYLGKYATDQWGQKVTVVNGIDISKTAFQIPDFERVLEFSRKVGERLYHARLVNIDVMIDKNEKPVLIEYNLIGMGTWVYQFNSQVAYGKYADEIIDYCARHPQDARHVLIEY